MRLKNHTARGISRALFAAFLSLAFTGRVNSQEALDYRALDAIEREAVALLLEKDMRKVIDQLAEERPTTVVPLLRRLILYARAGRRDSVRQTLEQLGNASDWQSCARSYHVRAKVKQSIGDDLAAWRLYYEQLCPSDTEGAESFVRLWEQQGDTKELDSWLASHSAGDDEWFSIRLYRRARLGTAGELLEPLVAAVKANPRDLDLVERYLRANDWAGGLQDVAWIGHVCEMTGAYEHYELGDRLGNRAPAAAARLLEKSLTLPLTERDVRLVRQRGLRFLSIVPAKLNWEKQLRFWTKQRLAEAYQALKRPHEAQPLIEELVAMKGDDILDQDAHHLAGGVQRESGQRVVETGILRNEATQRETAKYWLERADYYGGREEYDLKKETYLKALVALPYSTTDNKVAAERFEVVRSFAFFLKEDRDRRAGRSELEALLRQEFNNARPETDYAFRVARILANKDLELDALRRSLFVARPNLLARLLEARKEWGNEEEALIEAIVRGDEITAAEKDAIWTALEKLVDHPGSMRAYHLAEAMAFCGASQRATPLWLEYLKNAPPKEYVDKNQILAQVIRSYSNAGEWQAAEKLLFSNGSGSWKAMTEGLGPIAVSAAKHGATSDAVRLWRLKANLDRRDLTGLDELSHSEARAELRAFYLQMKEGDPLTTIPEQALRLLQ
jgi:hypothetical protein